VPFHSWTPDVYQGAPTAVTAFMAAATKVAAFGALLRLFYVAFGADRSEWIPMIWIIATLTMVVGSALALTQTDIKRLLAYSSIAHAGFILTGFLGIRSLDEGAEPEAHAERHHEPELDPALDPELDPEFEPIPAFRSMVPFPSDGNGISETNGDAQEGDKSLRFRLAQSAARKKGLGDLEPPSS